MQNKTFLWRDSKKTLLYKPFRRKAAISLILSHQKLSIFFTLHLRKLRIFYFNRREDPSQPVDTENGGWMDLLLRNLIIIGFMIILASRF